MPTENQPAEPLKVERSTVTKLVITGAPNLDPITVFLEDLAPCKGKITVSCWGKSWTAYWRSMWDGLNIAQFFCELNTSYIIGYFDQKIAGHASETMTKNYQKDHAEIVWSEAIPDLNINEITG
ncbi:hypothetical protein C1893_17070 [Pseudomonas sp. MPR-ANC1]|nr:hypothetical protein C1893_17070 [Pseudomonas sp. MPR-ANC1]